LEVLERIAEVRRIKIKSITADKNLAQMAEEIIDKCKYIHPSRLEEVEQLLIQLRKHQQAMEKKYGSSNGPLTIDTREIDRDAYDPAPRPSKRKESPKLELPPSKLDELDDYLDMLYQVSSKSDRERDDAMKKQILGTAMILQLCREIPNLEHLIQNSTVMGALTRVLQDEYKKSEELTYNILRIFLSFSNFMEMHPIMTNYKIGALTMKVVEFELKRIELREQERIDNDKNYEEELLQLRQSSENPSVITEFVDKMKVTKAKELQKTSVLQKKQDKVLFVCFYLLINLAEDISVERKMMKKDLIH
jgi:hypothetical protein